MRSVRFAAIVVAVIVSSSVQAHHSGAMFDQARVVELTGTVREFQWTNPHSFIQLVVASGGKSSEWSVEMGAPSGLFRHGWKPRTLKPGDKVTLKIHPMRDGSFGGTLLSAMDASGQPIGNGV